MIDLNEERRLQIRKQKMRIIYGLFGVAIMEAAVGYAKWRLLGPGMRND